jgi:hypothetical protein
VSRAEADRDVIRLNNEATAKVFENQIKAFGTGMNFARYNFYQKIGPRISSVISSDDKSGLGAVFQPFLPPGKEGSP